jgi:hypothetical protein
MPILLRFRGERSRLSSLSSSLSKLRCTPAVAAAEGGSWIGGMLEGPKVGARAEDDDIGGSCVVSRDVLGGRAGIVVVGM